jgi:hypothetical protein
MAAADPDYTTWLPVIGRSLARLALSKATESERDSFKDVLARVDFLEALGLPARRTRPRRLGRRRHRWPNSSAFAGTRAMAKKAVRRARATAAEGQQQGTPALDKIAALLGLLVVKDMETDDASVRLGNVGFSDREIAALIGVTDGSAPR